MSFVTPFSTRSSFNLDSVEEGRERAVWAQQQTPGQAQQSAGVAVTERQGLGPKEGELVSHSRMVLRSYGRKSKRKVWLLPLRPLSERRWPSPPPPSPSSLLACLCPELFP